jgi:hypothetical protein
MHSTRYQNDRQRSASSSSRYEGMEEVAERGSVTAAISSLVLLGILIALCFADIVPARLGPAWSVLVQEVRDLEHELGFGSAHATFESAEPLTAISPDHRALTPLAPLARF